MKYAKVVFGLPVEGPFDYAIPRFLAGKVKVGSRVAVSFGPSRKTGYVVALSPVSEVKNIKAITSLLDAYPLIDRELLRFTRELARYYACSWGEAIECALPQKLRGSYKTDCLPAQPPAKAQKTGYEVTVFHCVNQKKKYAFYLERLRQTLDKGFSAVVLFADIFSAAQFKQNLELELPFKAEFLSRRQKEEWDNWLKIKNGQARIAIGTRSAVFAPFSNLGLMIIDEEADPAYKQDQSPHYHAREAALMRARLSCFSLILASELPSLESYYYAKKHKFNYLSLVEEKEFPELTLTKPPPYSRRAKARKAPLSVYLEQAIRQAIENHREKVLLIAPRAGFAPLAECNNCGLVLKCPRCSVPLGFHLKNRVLSCRYCAYKMSPPELCPQCRAGYIRFLGLGIEKIENELSRIFPQAKIKEVGPKGLSEKEEADIFIATGGALRNLERSFDLAGVINIGAFLNRIDFRAGEKTLRFLARLMGLSVKKLVIQSALFRHLVFQALKEKNFARFYEEELKQRRQLKFPPFYHFALVRVRGKNEAKVKEKAEELFAILEKNKEKGIEVFSLAAANPPKLRGNFYWQLLLSSLSAPKAARFLKTCLKNSKHSGIIVTIDIDPV